MKTMTQDKTELKPCPFCGGKEIDVVIAGPIQTGIRWIGYGVCKECLCRGGWFEGLGFNARLAKKIVVDNWNRRVK